jgi:hypothetical protein
MFESSSRFFSAEQKNKTSFFSLFCKIIIIAKLSLIFFLFFQFNNQDNELIAELVLNFLFSKKIKDKFFVFFSCSNNQMGFGNFSQIRVSSLVHIVRWPA